MWTAGTDKILCCSRNRSALHLNQSNEEENCNKTLKRPERSALRPNESWTGYWTTLDVPSWSKMACYNQTARHLSMFFALRAGYYSSNSSREVKDTCQTRHICSHPVYSLSFFERSMTFFWPKHRRQRLVIVPIPATTNRMSPRTMYPTNPHVQKQCTPSHLVRHIQKGSCPLGRESGSKNPFQQRSNSAQSPATIGRGPSRSQGVWAFTLMVRTLTGVVPRIQPRRRPWGLFRPPLPVASIP